MTTPQTALPKTQNTPVLRTDYSDQPRWEAVREAIETPNEDEFKAYVDYLDDPIYRDLTPEQILTLVPDEAFGHRIVIVADAVALASEEMPMLVIDVSDERGRAIRVVVEELWGIENNLSIANMDYVEFADSVDEDGVFRGF
ncbi:hypothetical protein [Actinomadura sp. DC4]|uniref:DUF6924 domain-containing protein n=1 Tax=Actinomadura sp. DC4 TaxID=3055069 RepID=UPI0025B15197|nr:hypothetical protein [Actinomadura sp. DC4]MDN3356163.1 hypothetical protein [Actinomadura sp. DC4]